MDLNKITKLGCLDPRRPLWVDPGVEHAVSYYHWERVHMPEFMSNSEAWKRRKNTKSKWSNP
ncbi:MAG: hypothetical protein KAS32_04635 [Candidatus Peribacteraceae bacterium]|nr:hypothetical protein [Candidatus Peribacteraceae bacterium]